MQTVLGSWQGLTAGDIRHVANTYFFHGSNRASTLTRCFGCLTSPACNRLVSGRVWPCGFFFVHACCPQQTRNMPKLSELAAGPLAKANCAANLELGAREGVS